MNLHPFAISNLLIILTSFFLATVVFTCGRTRLTRIYFLFVISVGIWGLGAFLSSTSRSPELSLVLWRFTYLGVICLSIFYLHTVFLLTGIQNRAILFLNYLQGSLFILINMSGIMFKTVKFMFGSYYVAQGRTEYLISFIFWIIIIFSCHFLLIKFYIKKKDKQIFIYELAGIIGFGGGLMNFLQVFGINIYPIGNFFIPIYVLIMTYGILKYQILEINIVVQRSFIYSILIALITAIYFIFVFLAEKFFQGMVGYTSFVVSILCAFIIALFFTPVKNMIQYLADRLFLGKDPMQIAQENEMLRQELLRSERLKAVATFASGMAHEIKNPLTALKTFAEYLPQKINDSDFVQKFSKIVSSEVGKIDNLVHQLLDFSKPSLQLKETSIHTLIDETLELLSSQLIKHNISVKKVYFVPEALIKIDAMQIKQAFLNLFLNSIDAMPNGGELTVQTSQQTNQLTISIEDAGCGIPEKDLSHIFEPFYSTKEKGSGLGLSIVYNIIKEHNGKISVVSKLNKGTLFSIILLKNNLEL